ncbi:MAG: hypothetical protein KL787_11040 [Taibaiella sp.]|nr:hypothetical protein [Taibaiella sp.]
MNSLIKRTNKYLIERYPNIWNARLIWMLPGGLLIHLLFFITGYFILSYPGQLKSYLSDETIMGNYGVGLFSAVVSIVMIVIWIIYLIKNNAFKNFYPYTGWKLFLNFWYYLIVFFLLSSFYISFAAGYKTYIARHYPEDKIEDQIEKSNLASIFFNFSLDHYDLKYKRYPSPYDTLYIETNPASVNTSQPYYRFKGKDYQFYSIGRDTFNRENYDSINAISSKSFTNYYLNDSMEVYLWKKQVVPLAQYPDTAYSYLNYSLLPFSSGNGYYYSSYPYSQYETDQHLKTYSEKWHSLFDPVQKNEIEKVLQDFLAVCKAYDIPTNLTLKQWLDLVLQHNDTEVDSFIYNADLRYGVPEGVTDLMVTVDAAAGQAAIDAANADSISTTIAEREKNYLQSRMTRYYIDQNALQNSFQSLGNLRDFDFVTDALKVMMYLSLALALVLLMFRVTDLRTLIFSVVVAGIISVLVSLLLIITSMGVFGSNRDLVILYMLLGVAFMILILPFFLRQIMSKLVRGIHLNLVLGNVTLFLLLLILIIDAHLELAFESNIRDYTMNSAMYTSLFEIYENEIIFGLWTGTVLVILLFSSYIKKWKGSPEQ